MLNRRTFAVSGMAALAFAGLARRSLAAPNDSYVNQVPGYGDLVDDPAGLLDLPPAFTYAILSRAGEIMDDGYFAPGHFDGMGAFPLGPNRVALVRNHELRGELRDRGPTGALPRLDERLLREGVFGRDNDGRPLPGGTSTIVYDLRRRRPVRQFLSLAGTLVNCAGGTTPWGSWLSCEEATPRQGQVERDHGWVFEVPADGSGLAAPVPLAGLGRFRHEAAAVDPRTGIVYLTEDREDSLFYRFLPAAPGRLQAGGRLQALVLRDLPGADTRNWTDATIAPGSAHAAHWIDLEDIGSPNDDLRQRGHADGAALFARGEGIHFDNGQLYFCCTSGGRGRYGQIMRYRPSATEGRTGEAARPGTLDLFVESADPRVLDYADNITVAPWGHLIACEDRGGGEVCHLKGVTPQGRIYTVARLGLPTELAGACFSPDGSTLFLNIYHPGHTLAITGPWSSLRDA